MTPSTQSNPINLPVEPNPPAPRSLAGSSVTVSHVTRVTGATTIWAIRIPRSTVTAARPRLINATFTSPR